MVLSQLCSVFELLKVLDEVSFLHVLHHNERGVLIADSKYTNDISISQS